MKQAALLLALALGFGCAHQGGPGELGTDRGSGASIETSVGSSRVDAEVTRDIEESPERPVYRDVPDASGPGTRGQLGMNSPTQGRTVTGQETNFLLNKDRGSVRSATDRFRPGGDYTGVDDARGRVLLTPGLDQGSAPEPSGNPGLDRALEGPELQPGVSDPPNSQSGDDVPRAAVEGAAPPAASADDLAAVGALSVAPYRIGGGSSFSLSSRSSFGLGSSAIADTGSSSGFSSAEIGSGVRSTTSTRYGALSTDVPAPGLNTAFSTGQESAFGPQDRAASAYSNDREQRVGSSAMAATRAAAGTDLSRGLPIEAFRNVDIISENGSLTLRGSVGTDSERINIENRVRQAVGLSAINNQLFVSPGYALPGENQIAPDESRAD